MNHLLFVRWMHRRPVDPSNQGTVMAKVFVWHGGRQHIHRGSLLLTLINFIPRMYYNYIQYRVQDETNYPPLKFENGYVISFHDLLGVCLFIHGFCVGYDARHC